MKLAREDYWVIGVLVGTILFIILFFGMAIK